MKSDFKPRMWQELALRRVKEFNYNALVQAPTAAGKTVFAMMVVSLLRIKKPGLKTVIIVPTITLLKQWKKELVKFLDVDEIEIGEYYGGKKDVSLEKKYMIYVINSAARDRNLFDQQKVNPFDFIVVDEVHHVGADSYKKLLEIESFRYRLGISATPEREYDREGTKKVIQYFKNRVDVSKKHVEVAPMTFNMIRLELTDSEAQKYSLLRRKCATCLSKLKKLYGLDSKRESFFKEITELAEAGVEEAKIYVSLIRKMEGIRFTAKNKLRIVRNLTHSNLNKKTIIFCDRIRFVKEIEDMLKRAYPKKNILAIHSELRKKQQKEQLNMFKHSKDGILIAAKIVDEGFDVPDASIGVLVSFTKSKRQSIQRDGRIMRFMANKIAKKYVLIIKDIDEESYCNILIKIDQIKQALEGSWLDFNDHGFELSNEFKTKFRLYYLNKLAKMEV